jgi:hypothetical protein
MRDRPEWQEYQAAETKVLRVGQKVFPIIAFSGRPRYYFRLLELILGIAIISLLFRWRGPSDLNKLTLAGSEL